MIFRTLKTAGISLSGLSPETIMSVKAPEPMPTPGYDKAKRILESASEIEKVSRAMGRYGMAAGNPTIGKLTKDPDSDGPPQTALDKGVSAGAHFAAGAGAGGAMTALAHGPKWAENQAVRGALERRKWYGAAAGGALGAAHWARKQYRRGQWEKQQAMEKNSEADTPKMRLKADRQVGTKKTHIGPTSGPTIDHQIRGALIGRKFVKKTAGMAPSREAIDRVRRTILTRAATRAQADALFGGPAQAMREQDQALVDSLFLQSAASQTDADNLVKVSRAESDVPWTPGERGAMGLGAAGLLYGGLGMPGGRAIAPIGAASMISAGAHKHFREMERAKKEKRSSANVEAYFDNREYLTEAQRRYPELLKAASGRGGDPSRPTPNLKPRITTPESGPDPVKSSLSGGAA